MAYIVQVIRNDRAETERRLQLAAEDFVRPLTFGTNWTRVRVGIRYCCLSTKYTAATILAEAAGFPTCSPRLFLGLCAGSKGYGSVNPTCVVGAQTRTANFTYASGNQGYYTISAWDGCFRKGETGARYAATATASVFATFAPVRCSLFVDVLKSYDVTAANSYQIFSYSTSSSAPYFSTDQSFSAFIEAGRGDTPGTGWTTHTSTPTTWGLTDADVDTLDSICVSWNRTMPLIEISNVIVNRIQ